MPYKDPEKRKAAKKAYDAKRAGQRHHEWTAVVYPESAPADWRDRLDEHHVMWAESPLHDRDVNPSGEPKKPHWHIALHFDTVKSYEQVTELLRPLKCPSAKYVQSMKGLIRYFVHEDNPEKAQYDRADIKTHGGFDVSAVFAPTDTEVAEIVREMMRFVVKYKVREFAELVVYAMEEQPEWFDVLNTRCYLIREFMKSRRFMGIEAPFANPVTGEEYDFIEEDTNESGQGSAQPTAEGDAKRP